MTIRVALNHRTSYRYDRPVSMSPQVVRLRPAPHCRTPICSYSMKVAPDRHFLNWQQDPHGNYLARLVVPQPTSEFSVEVDLVAEMTVVNPFDFFLEETASELPFEYPEELRKDLRPFLNALPCGPRMKTLLDRIPRGSTGTVDFLVDVNRHLKELIQYVIRLEPGVQSCEETLELQSGSCRDSAWLMVQLLRNLGLAARFVSGYLIQLKSDVPALDGPSGTERDFCDLHAWAEVYLPGAGWVGLDPTSGLLAGEGHLPLAATPNPGSAAPITGSVSECKAEFHFAMSVQRIHEDPRVTLPYSAEQWTRIGALGQLVDAALEADAVHLTMGGEPTFVSADDLDSPEWNTAALGAGKRKAAGNLFKRLANKFGQGPLLHFGQGKWYPGESLPRWALSCYWRRDGVAIWKEPRLVAHDEMGQSCQAAEAKAMICRLAELLDVPEECVQPAYEDAWYYLWKERRLPANVDPLTSNLQDEEERARLARIFERGLNEPAGYVLPLRPRLVGRDGPRWDSGAWLFRPGAMFLLPGDSPLGYRLPLDSLPWAPPEKLPMLSERDPLEPRDPLPQESQRAVSASPSNGRRRAPENARSEGASFQFPPYEARDGEHGGTATLRRTSRRRVAWRAASPEQVVRTALCVEARGGVLHVFMPPVPYLEDYLDLVAAVETAAADLDIPVRMEGYAPPYDFRLEHFKVTPDPGVIEVNLQPAHNWKKLVENTTTLYEEARQSRLRPEKFQLDGRHAGTGGGNHIVIGGPTPADSPVLRRPDLLRSLVAYWNNRPSLSYLFSGLFIGPTSQAPRVDEARTETLHELEIAFRQIPEKGPAPPWLVDRVFRHLLVDATGNTHRTEFCIDKLFSPDAASGRLGLVELRSFEMPPHARMSLTQQLLLRAMISRFWRVPYRERLVRWGTALHDRFMLPHFVSADFSEVLEEMRDAGYPFELDWFAPHFEFRFPLIGQVAHRNIEIEVRQAIEPWHVLGEEVASSGTARYVDSSLDRIQIKVRGMTDQRHIVACNGRRVPMHPTGTVGEFVAGVRFRAWQPPSCLHPTIPVHTPLVFDVLDIWNGRSIGGCTWHVAHPGGRHFERFPVNAYEAESRRAARFFAMGHTGGPAAIPVVETNPDYPMTLDLRRTSDAAPPGNARL